MRGAIGLPVSMRGPAKLSVAMCGVVELSVAVGGPVELSVAMRGVVELPLGHFRGQDVERSAAVFSAEALEGALMAGPPESCVVHK